LESDQSSDVPIQSLISIIFQLSKGNHYLLSANMARFMAEALCIAIEPLVVHDNLIRGECVDGCIQCEALRQLRVLTPNYDP
jgi:hypothetical protein